MSLKKDSNVIKVICAMKLKVTYIVKNENGSVSRYSQQSQNDVPFFKDNQILSSIIQLGNRTKKNSKDYCYSPVVSFVIPLLQGQNRIEKVIYKLQDAFKKGSFSLEFNLDFENNTVVHDNLPGIYYRGELQKVNGKMILGVVIAMSRNHLIYETSSGKVSTRYSLTPGVAKSSGKSYEDKDPQLANVTCALRNCNEEAGISCNCGQVKYCSKDHLIEHWEQGHFNNCQMYSYE